MLEQPQQFYDAEGRGHDMPMQQETIERRIADQMMPVNDLHTTLRNVRSTVLCEERAHQESNLKKSGCLNQHRLECDREAEEEGR
ncbi:hypothetical protein Y032_0153g2912 [Ancylostoma ceylanicum]|uniref:Uncharacterized protein n=1 Tax=Ancylostoma ceylanicum TaxID=53326 RepID=A0A016T073_9BILA|nr:hypothetical protein Y032_0153g2912 [Ancylostoma ceylanicum]